MIIKSTDTKQNLNKRCKSGFQAEKQMSFYLKRAFQKEKDIFVINDLRLVLNDDVAQIDHLIVHRYGFIIIESKSVTTKIKINEHGEWIRFYGRQYQGMPSPVKQAERQASFLKNFLSLQSKKLLKNRKIFKSSFEKFTFEVLVAISDKGVIERPKGSTIDRIYKADQVADNIIEMIEKYKKVNKNLLNPTTFYQFADSSMEKIVKYLEQSHKPKTTHLQTSTAKTKEISSVNNPVPQEHTCSKCGGQKISMTYGRYGYYFKCHSCGGNTSLKLKCSNKSCKPKIRKEGNNFYKECSSCNLSELYFKNKNIEQSIA